MVERSTQHNLSISVCIATHERPRLLKTTLEALASQSRLPDEIVVSDSSSTKENEDVVRAFAQSRTSLAVKYVKSERRALPWQRWWAFSHSSGEIVLFVDDDVRLAPPALETLEATYTEGSCDSACPRSIAGVGFIKVLDGDNRVTRGNLRLKERWLGQASLKPGTITSGGIYVPHRSLSNGAQCVAVDWLWGGAMSYRRDVLLKVGPLEHLFDLYDAGIGKGEDGVLSNQARQFGRLLLLTGPYAFHPTNALATKTAYSTGGYRRGLLDTWGLANTFRWMSTRISANKRDWTRYALFVLARGIVGLMSSPLRAGRWSYLAGWGYGVYHTIINWKKIPASPQKCVRE